MPSRAERLASVTTDCASVGVDLGPVIRNLFFLRLLQFGTCLTAGILAVTLTEDEQSLPSVALDFLAAILTVVKTLVLYYRPDGVFRGRLSFILDLVNAGVLIGAGSAQSSYVKDLPDPSVALTACYILSFVGAGLFFPSALRIRRVYVALKDVTKQRLIPAAASGDAPPAYDSTA